MMVATLTFLYTVLITTQFLVFLKMVIDYMARSIYRLPELSECEALSDRDG